MGEDEKSKQMIPSESDIYLHWEKRALSDCILTCIIQPSAIEIGSKNEDH